MTKQATVKSDKRERAKAYRQAKAAKAAAARRRRQALVGVIAALAVAGVTVGIYQLVRTSDDLQASDPTVSPTAVLDADGNPLPPEAETFPPLPADADPALMTKPEVTKGEGELTELKVTTLVEGTGPIAQLGSTVKVNYVGVFYISGEQFDSSWDRQQAASFELAPGRLIDGWVKGLDQVKVGSRVQLDIPAAMAYGDPPPEGRPEGPLRFVVDLLGVS